MHAQTEHAPVLLCLRMWPAKRASIGATRDSMIELDRWRYDCLSAAMHEIVSVRIRMHLWLGGMICVRGIDQIHPIRPAGIIGYHAVVG